MQYINQRFLPCIIALRSDFHVDILRHGIQGKMLEVFITCQIVAHLNIFFLHV